jgi:hypothetical protein
MNIDKMNMKEYTAEVRAEIRDVEIDTLTPSARTLFLTKCSVRAGQVLLKYSF